MERPLLAAIVLIMASAIEALLVAAKKSRQAMNATDPSVLKTAVYEHWYQLFKVLVYLTATCVLYTILWQETQ